MHNLENFKKCLKTLETKMAEDSIVLMAVDILNDRVLPYFEHNDLPVLRSLTDRRTE